MSVSIPTSMFVNVFQIRLNKLKPTSANVTAFAVNLTEEKLLVTPALSLAIKQACATAVLVIQQAQAMHQQ